ncbi:MAG: BREX system P-loop protein BrxC, partial [Prevotella sp.]
MSKIGEMFVKDIGRRMNPVIMAGDQSDEAIIFQELDEYVVTQEIDENLETFYKAFLDGIKNRTSNIGAWVSGDFGSGKSHFLKVLSYLLKNDTVVGKKPIDYFKEKVSPQVLTLMQAVEKKNIDTILFDIDSESKEGQNADNLVQIYLMVFNRMCGLSTVAAVANMERYLISENKYDRFKEEFEKTSGKTWESQRTKPTFIKSKIEAALLNSGAYNNSEDAKRVANEVTLKYDISSSEFAELVNEHCMKKGDDYVLVFLVDEVGQFISKKTQVMLKLQSITQDLGSTCRGKVWNIVTSQEDMDLVFSGVNNNDFSKIQGRFPTRVKMSTSDVKEVIEKRVLLKKSEYLEELKAYYEGERESIHNKLNFDNGMHIALYK